MSGREPTSRSSWKRFPWRRGTLPKRGRALATDCVLALFIAAVAVGVVATETNTVVKGLVAGLAAFNLLFVVQEVRLWRRARAAEPKR